MNEATLTVELKKDKGGRHPLYHEGLGQADDMDIRDKLALERTYLAKERTTLSYIRTGITFVGVALFIWRFLEVDILWKWVLSAAFVLPGAYAVIYGMYKIMDSRNDRKMFEENHIATRRRWKAK